MKIRSSCRRYLALSVAHLFPNHRRAFAAVMAGTARLAVVGLVAGWSFFGPGVPGAAAAEGGGWFIFRQPQKQATELTSRQPPAQVSARLMERASPDNTRVLVSISKQRIYLMLDEEIVIDSPISSGRRGHPTPTGNFRIMEKDLNHASSIYGDYVDRNGRTVRSGISSKIDAQPAGTRYVGAPMRYFCRLTSEGVGFHIGILPGYPASHGCIRLPADIAPRIYEKVRVGTNVRVES